MSKGLTTHVSFDISDDKLGPVMRALIPFKVENLTQQLNGSSPAKAKKGEHLGKMHGLSINEVIVAFINKADAPVGTPALRKAMEDAGFSSSSLGTYLTNLVKSKHLKRVGPGQYGPALKQLPAPAKKKAS